MRFRVESVLADRGIVFARALEPGAMRLTSRATLGARPVAHLDLPRPRGADGAPDLGLVGFFLAFGADVVHFRVGAEVEYAE